MGQFIYARIIRIGYTVRIIISQSKLYLAKFRLFQQYRSRAVLGTGHQAYDFDQQRSAQAGLRQLPDAAGKRCRVTMPVQVQCRRSAAKPTRQNPVFWRLWAGQC